LLVFLIFYLQKNLPGLTQSPNSTPQKSIISTEAFVPTKTITLIPASKTSSATFTPTKNKTPTLTATVAVLQEEIVDDNGVTMRVVLAGEFAMGSNSGRSNEKPVHQVYLEDFYMDKYEVTNALYKACEKAGGCTPPQQTKSYTHSSYYGYSEFDNYPVVYVDWNQAVAYCKWRKSSLPTEAQWEKAARGTDKRTYPWGNDTPNKDLLNYNSNVGDMIETGSYKNGKSPYEIYDLAGNVWEWMLDGYSETYYETSPSENPLGPNSIFRVVRGGSWSSNTDNTRSAYRYNLVDVYSYGDVGFRCARDAKP
jgi:formylglycine-generating enzyme required for sulfatase activity